MRLGRRNICSEHVFYYLNMERNVCAGNVQNFSFVSRLCSSSSPQKIVGTLDLLKGDDLHGRWKSTVGIWIAS